MKVKNFVVFFISFVVFLFIFAPYEKIYSYAIGKIVEENRIDVSYKVAKALPFSMHLDYIDAVFGGENYKVDNVVVKLNPLFFAGNSIARLSFENGEAEFAISKDSNGYFIKGYFLTSLLRGLLKQPFKGFLANMNGKNSVFAKVSFSNNSLIINKLEINGDINVEAKGYISRSSMHLNGTIKIGKIKQRFSI